MIVYIAFVTGFCTLVLLWAIGLNTDVAGLVGLGILFLGVLAHVVSGMLAGESEER